MFQPLRSSAQLVSILPFPVSFCPIVSLFAGNGGIETLALCRRSHIDTVMQNGRYLLYMDILGFSALVARKGTDEVYGIITAALDEFDRWEKLNGQFRTIYFSDTFIFYQEPKGFGEWAFLDVYAIGGMLLSALLAKGVAARGAISFGEFVVKTDNANKRQVYFGQALIDAYVAEQKENWIGISILPNAWKPYDESSGGKVAVFENEGVWLRRDDTLLLNPFIKLRAWYEADQLGEIDRPYYKWDVPSFPNDLAAFKYIHDQSQRFIATNDFASRVATKYHSTVEFLRSVFGHKYDWACKVSGVNTA